MKAIIQLRRMLFALPLVMSALFLPASCKKQQQDSAQNTLSIQSLTESAKNYFDGLASSKGAPALPAGKKKVSMKNIKVQPVNRFAQISKTIDWQNAFGTQAKGITYLFVPVKEDIKPFANKNFEFFRYLVFSKITASMVNLSLIEVLGDKGYSFESGHEQIATAAFKNKLEEKTGNIGNANASVIFYDNNYKPTVSFKLNNGAWSAARISFRSDLGIR